MNVLKKLLQGDYRVTLHAKIRMAQRRITHSDIQVCGGNGKVSSQLGGKIKVVGKDLDGEPLTVICVEEEDVIIITTF